jgi:hypothetical protein
MAASSVRIATGRLDTRATSSTASHRGEGSSMLSPSETSRHLLTSFRRGIVFQSGWSALY